MKIGAILLTAALASAGAFAQDSPTSPARPQLEVTRPIPPTIFENLEKPSREKKPTTVTYGGLAHDIAKSGNRWRMFSLRRPADPKVDAKNLDEPTDRRRTRGFKIFTINF